jgi:tubulin polyglutamylase TTLL9
MKRRGWVEVTEDTPDEWDIFFCDLNQLRDIFTSNIPLMDHQRVGHFRNCFEISRKNLMVKNLKRLKTRIERAFGKEEGEKCNFFPTTYVLPCEHKIFIQEFRRLQNEGALWIIKPAAGAQGKGIFIFQKFKDYQDWRQKFDATEALDSPTSKVLSTSSSKENLAPFQPSDSLSDATTSDISPSPTDPEPTEPPNREPGTFRASEVYVVQRYIDNPYLIGGRKFDIRFYVLVTSFMPLKAWIYREGFARFSGGQFSLESLQDIYVHLTNIAIQRTSEDYNPEKGSKWSLRSLREYLTARHGRDEVQKLMNSIDNIIVRTLQSAHQLVVQDRHCFEIYGFDVIIDSHVRPWLLEVNASPAFTPSNEEDYRLKCAIIDDTVHVLDLENRLTGYEKRVGGYDLFWNDGPVYANPGDCGHSCGIDNGPKLNSFLGCLNDRVLQLRQIFRNAHFLRETQHILSSPHFSTLPSTASPEQPSQGKHKKDQRFRVPNDGGGGSNSGRSARRKQCDALKIIGSSVMR